MIRSAARGDELLVGAELVSGKKLSSLIDECNQLIAILTSISKKVKANMDKCPPSK